MASHLMEKKNMSRMPLWKCFSILCAALFASNFAGAASISSAHDYKKIQAYLHQLNQQFPQSTELFVLGTSGTGDTIDGIKIGHGPVKNLIVATHHGNEYGSTEVALGAAADLAKNPITHETVYIIPVLNVSGFNVVRREESLNGASTMDLVDANRDYPGPCGTEGPFRLKSTKALADFIDREGIVSSATLHTFYPVVAYPWGFSTPDLTTPYESLFIDLAKMATELSHYPVGNSAEAIYPADGTFEDYAFWKHGIWSLLFELGDTHSPSENELQQLVAVNAPGLRKMMENAPTSRAPDHEFKGKCDMTRRYLDRHNE
jgi:carboxypeptidase T